MPRVLAALPLTLLLVAAAAAAPAAPVTAAAYAPGGKTLAVGTRSAVTLVDPAAGAATATLGGVTGRVTALAYSPDGTLAAAAGEPGKAGTLTLFAPAATTPAVTWTAHRDAVYALAFSPDGKRLASAGYDRTVKLWAVPGAADAEPVRVLADHSDAVYGLAFHPAGRLLATAAADRTVKVWDVAGGTRLYTLSDPTDVVAAVGWSPDGTRLAAAGADRSVRVWAADASGGRLLKAAVAHEKPVTRLAWAADGKRLVTVADDRRVKVWDAATLAEVAGFAAGPDAVLSAALNPAGTEVAAGNFDGAVRLIDLTTGTTRTPSLVPKPAVAAVAPDALPRGPAGRVAVTGTHLDRVTAVRAPAGVTASIAPGRTPTRLDLDVTAAATTPVGRVTLTLAAGPDAAAEVKLWVDAFAAVPEPASTDAARSAAVVALPATVAGVLDRPGDVDYFAVTLAAGQPVGVRLGTALGRDQFAPVLFATDAAGRTLAESAAGSLAFTAPAAGRYTLAVRDRQFRGGPGFGYRLHAGPVPVVTAVRPLGVTRGTTAEVTLVGVHLGVTAVPVTVPADAAVGAKVAVPLPAGLAAEVGPVEVVAGEFPAVAVTDKAGTLPAVPGTADGVLATPGEAHRVRFRALKGQKVVVEVEAQRVGSAADPVIEVADAAGRVVPRAVLRAVAKAVVAFRDHDSVMPGVRLEAWNELAVDDYLYADGELMRIDRLPPTPDDDCPMCQADGKRAGFLGTTPTYHAFGSPLYKVELHPPGRTFPPTGMPVVTLPYRNDDAGGPLGRDCQLTFDPPADGEYEARVADTAGTGGPAHGYRLTVRPPRPGFTLAVSPANPAVWAGGGVPVTVTAARRDDFGGPIDLAFAGLPPGFAVPPTRIEAGQLTAVVPLTATAAATPPADAKPWRVVGRAVIDGRPAEAVAAVAAPTVRPGGDLSVTTAVPEITIRPGGDTRLTVRVERHGDFAARVPVRVEGLPHGVRVIDIGLSGILVLPGQTTREVVVRCEPWVKPMAVPFVVWGKSERKQTEHAAPAVTLRVAE